MEMESVNELDDFSINKEAPSPVAQRKFKRLKKATPTVDPSSTSSSFSPVLETQNTETFSDGNIDEPIRGSEPGSAGFAEEKEISSGFEGVGVEEDDVSVKRHLESDSLSDGYDGKDKYQEDDFELGDIMKDLQKEEAEKKRRFSDDSDETKEVKKSKKKSKKKKKEECDGFDDSPVSPGSIKMTKKERSERLNQLRYESQRLIRETRDAGFKQVPLVHKPISSVLEKIRKRKLEVSRKFASMKEHSVSDDRDAISGEEMLVDDSQNAGVKERNDVTVDMESEEVVAKQSSADDKLENSSSQQTVNQCSQEASPSKIGVSGGSTQTFRAPIDDTQDLITDSQSDSKDEHSEETPSSPFEEVLAPSLLTMNLKLDSALPHDVSSDDEDNEEDNEKENTVPHQDVSLPKGDPVKAFLDDEAEEEDDSDNDLLRFQDHEEYDDEEDEELKDLIATGYEEKQIDTDMRNELHHKWLEQQEAAGTDNLMQKLKRGLQQRETSLLGEEENGETQQDIVESDDESEDDSVSVKMNMKKLREMIPLMFTDKEDKYISDDEEVDRKLVKQSLFKKSEDQAKLVSPSEDEDSKELFCRIKKVNNVQNQKKAKVPFTSEKLLFGRSKNNVPSKSSFLSLGSNHSVPQPSKRLKRNIIFERNDSSKKTSISTADDSSEAIVQQNRKTKSVTAKFTSCSQVKSSSQSTQDGEETSTRTSLYEILKRSSLRSRQCSSEDTADVSEHHTESIFSAFKLVIEKQKN